MSHNEVILILILGIFSLAVNLFWAKCYGNDWRDIPFFVLMTAGYFLGLCAVVFGLPILLT